jgi:hypothetical protein
MSDENFVVKLKSEVKGRSEKIIMCEQERERHHEKMVVAKDKTRRKMQIPHS